MYRFETGAAARRGRRSDRPRCKRSRPIFPATTTSRASSIRASTAIRPRRTPAILGLAVGGGSRAPNPIGPSRPASRSSNDCRPRPAHSSSPAAPRAGPSRRILHDQRRGGPVLRVSQNSGTLLAATAWSLRDLETGPPTGSAATGPGALRASRRENGCAPSGGPRRASRRGSGPSRRSRYMGSRSGHRPSPFSYGLYGASLMAVATRAGDRRTSLAQAERRPCSPVADGRVRRSRFAAGGD
jgi:hypothetical protein